MTKPRPMAHFFTKVAGVSHANADGSSRQAAIARCRVGDSLLLDHEQDNIHDANAVRVCRQGGEQLGFLRVVNLADGGYRGRSSPH